jgi:hypothetical protein
MDFDEIARQAEEMVAAGEQADTEAVQKLARTLTSRPSLPSTFWRSRSGSGSSKESKAPVRRFHDLRAVPAALRGRATDTDQRYRRSRSIPQRLPTVLIFAAPKPRTRSPQIAPRFRRPRYGCGR